MSDVLKERIDLLEKRVDLLEKELSVDRKAISNEFNEIGKFFEGFSGFGYTLRLELAALLEILHKKEIIDEKSFSEELEKTSKAMEEAAKKNYEERKQQNLASGLDEKGNKNAEPESNKS
jgi:hypothetical protein